MIPRTIFEPEHELFRDAVRRFLEREAVPFHERWEEEGQVSRELWLKAGEQGFLCPMAPEEFGGAGADFRYHAIVCEELYAAGLTGPGWTLHSDVALPYLLHQGSVAQKRKYIPGMVSGEIIAAIAMTEPGAGSDLQGVRTRAVPDGDGWVLNGAKTFITNGQMADVVIVVARTDPGAGSRGISLFLVDAGLPGFSRGRNLKKIGLKAQDTSELFFEDVRLPAEALLGEVNRGFAYLMQELPQERLTIAISATASLSAVLQQTIDYTRERKAFGKPLLELQNTQFELAEMAAEATAMQVFIDRCIELHLDGQLDVPTVAKAKLLSTELQCRVIDRCLQLHGGYGYMWEYPVARAWADSRVQRIYGGSNEIMKLVIARNL